MQAGTYIIHPKKKKKKTDFCWQEIPLGEKLAHP